MDLTEEWGEENLRYEDPVEEYAQWLATKNEKIRAAMPQEVKDNPINAEFGTEAYELPSEGPTDFRDVFTGLVRTKERRIGLEAPPGLFVTKYRGKDSPDPRTTVRFYV